MKMDPSRRSTNDDNNNNKGDDIAEGLQGNNATSDGRERGLSAMCFCYCGSEKGQCVHLVTFQQQGRQQQHFEEPALPPQKDLCGQTAQHEGHF